MFEVVFEHAAPDVRLERTEREVGCLALDIGDGFFYVIPHMLDISKEKK